MANENETAPTIEIEKRLREEFKASFDVLRRESGMALDSLKEQVRTELQSVKAYVERVIRERDLALDELASFKAKDSDVVEGAGERCEDPSCNKRATVTYIWPGTLQTYRGCADHAQRAAMAVASMGSELKLTPIGAPATVR